MTQIVAWFGTFIINVPLAQAAFQMAVSCCTPGEARKVLIWACLFGYRS
jgi:solute:Na+ symporter, SSS family